VGLLRYATATNLTLSLLVESIQSLTSARTLDAFHQKCLRQLLGIRWYDRVRNEVLQRTGLTSLSHLLSRRRISVFGHVARLDDVTPANMAVQLHVNVSLSRPPDRTWRRPPGWSSTEQVARPATKRFHPSHRRPLEACCRPWTWWCNDAMALAGHATMMLMMRRTPLTTTPRRR